MKFHALIGSTYDLRAAKELTAGAFTSDLKVDTIVAYWIATTSWPIEMHSQAAHLHQNKKGKKKPPDEDGPVDKSEHCGVWAAAGECDKNSAYMWGECAASCTSVADGGASLLQ